MNITPARLTITIVAVLIVAFVAQAVSYADQRIAPIEAYVDEDRQASQSLAVQIDRLNSSIDHLALTIERLPLPQADR